VQLSGIASRIEAFARISRSHRRFFVFKNRRIFLFIRDWNTIKVPIEGKSEPTTHRSHTHTFLFQQTSFDTNTPTNDDENKQRNVFVFPVRVLRRIKIGSSEVGIQVLATIPRQKVGPLKIDG